MNVVFFFSFFPSTASFFVSGARKGGTRTQRIQFQFSLVDVSFLSGQMKQRYCRMEMARVLVSVSVCSLYVCEWVCMRMMCSITHNAHTTLVYSDISILHFYISYCCATHIILFPASSFGQWQRQQQTKIRIWTYTIFFSFAHKWMCVRCIRAYCGSIENKSVRRAESI